MDSSPSQTPSQDADLSVWLTLTVATVLFAKTNAASKSPILATHHPVVLVLLVWSILLVTPSVGVNQALSPSLTQSPAVDLSVFVTLTAKQDSFARTRNVLRNQIHATHLLAALVPFAWLTFLETPSAGVSLV
jgi:hypothetical protein